MASPDSTTRARAELVDLLESQLNTLEKETFGCVTEAELWEYEDRRDRICHLYAELIDREAPPSLARAARRNSRNDHLSDPRVVCCSAVGGQQSAESPSQSLMAAIESRARVDKQ
jgi:hypothetical protein